MADRQVVIRSSFIGKFKLGDNIVHNLAILKLLYEVFDQKGAEDRELLCKPIIVTIASIVEAILYDLHFKATHYIHEGVGSVSEKVLSYIRSRKIDEFEKYIASARKHELFGSQDAKIYDELEELRKLRNRVHIQNTKNHFEPDEGKAFNPNRKKAAEKLLEEILRTMEKNHSRSHSYVEDFVLPWAPYFSHLEGATASNVA